MHCCRDGRESLVPLRWMKALMRFLTLHVQRSDVNSKTVRLPRSVKIANRKKKARKWRKPPTQPRKEQAAKAFADSEKRDSSHSSNKQDQGPQCHNCHRFGHIAKFCWDKQKR